MKCCMSPPRLQVDEAPEGGGPGELLMESEPVVVDADSITTLQVRSLVSKDRMKMVCEMKVSEC